MSQSITRTFMSHFNRASVYARAPFSGRNVLKLTFALSFPLLALPVTRFFGIVTFIAAGTALLATPKRDKTEIFNHNNRFYNVGPYQKKILLRAQDAFKKIENRRAGAPPNARGDKRRARLARKAQRKLNFIDDVLDSANVYDIDAAAARNGQKHNYDMKHGTPRN